MRNTLASIVFTREFNYPISRSRYFLFGLGWVFLFPFLPINKRGCGLFICLYPPRVRNNLLNLIRSKNGIKVKARCPMLRFLISSPGLELRPPRFRPCKSVKFLGSVGNQGRASDGGQKGGKKGTLKGIHTGLRTLYSSAGFQSLERRNLLSGTAF